MRSPLCGPLFACILAVAPAAETSAAPLTFNTALPVGEGTFVLREQVVTARSGDDPSGAARERSTWTFVSVLGYGVTPELAVFGVVPYVAKALNVGRGATRRERRTDGLGDSSLFGRYTVYRRDKPGRTLRLAPFAGVKLPTGEDNESDELGRLPRGVQSGSGSWDPFFGLVLTYQTLAFQVDAQASYRLNTKANSFAFGDVARLDGSLQYRLWPQELGPGVPGFLYGVLEANLLHRAKNEVRGVGNPNSGGTSLLVVLGLQYVMKRWLVEAGVQIPAVQDLNGTALENDYVVRAGFRLNF